MRSAEREHYGLAVSCAKRFQGRGVAMEELISEAEAALLWAASRFDESRGVRFSTYAIPVVLGALRQLCRSQTPMHVPRSELRVLTRAQEARSRLIQRDGCEPDVHTLAAETGVDAHRLAAMLAAHERMRLCCGALDNETAMEEGFEDRVLLRDAVSRLPRPFAQVIWLRFGLGLTQTDLARRFGVSQPQISKWEKKGLALLRG